MEVVLVFATVDSHALLLNDREDYPIIQEQSRN